MYLLKCFYLKCTFLCSSYSSPCKYQKKRRFLESAKLPLALSHYPLAPILPHFADFFYLLIIQHALQIDLSNKFFCVSKSFQSKAFLIFFSSVESLPDFIICQISGVKISCQNCIRSSWVGNFFMTS